MPFHDFSLYFRGSERLAQKDFSSEAKERMKDQSSCWKTQRSEIKRV